MGRLVEGHWTPENEEKGRSDGRFVRAHAPYRNWVTADGAAGHSGEGGFKAEAGRYHLYVSYACPWAHRTLVFRALKGLADVIGVSVLSPKMPDATGWTFRDWGATGDSLYCLDHLYELYLKAKPGYTGRVTVPVLWDKQLQTIVSNESSEIIRMLNSAFNAITGNEDDYYPPALRAQIDAINARVYDTVNNGVYKTGFATKQDIYEANFKALFESLDWIEGLLSEDAYLAGSVVTEADWRLFTTLVRFDAVYFSHFKCNLRRIADYPNISHYLKGLVATPGVRDTVHIDHIKTHYYWSMIKLNPSQIVPLGPELDFLD